MVLPHPNPNPMSRSIVGCLIFLLPFVCSSQHKKFENITLQYSQLGKLLLSNTDTLIFDKVKFVNDGGATTWSMTLTQDSSGVYSYWATVYIASELHLPFPADSIKTI